MSETNAISYEALPEGDGIYRLYWGGLIQLSNSEDEAPKLLCWLNEIDRRGRNIPNRPSRRVVQSAGAIPRFHIGSLWQNKSPLLSSTITEPEPIEFEIEAPPSWSPVMASEKHAFVARGQDGRSHDWINPSDYRLMLDEGNGITTAAYLSWVVPMKSVSGDELIVPCYEIFRAFYAGSSELAWRLLTGPWHAIKSRFLRGAEEGVTPEGDRVIRLDPEAGMSKGVLPFLAALAGSKAMREGANKIHTDLLASAQEYGTQIAWIRAVPPFLNQRFRIKAHVIPLVSRPGFLVTKIERASFPLQDTQLVYVQDELVSDLTGADVGENPEDERLIHGQRRKDIDKAIVTKSGQRRATKRRFHLGIGTGFWLDASRPIKAVRKVRSVQPIGQSDNGPEPQIQAVGVGGPSDSRSPQHGSLEQGNDDETTGRMAAIQDLVSSLTGEVITNWVEWPLVNRTIIESNEYCALPTEQGDEKSRAWARGNGGPGEPPRLAWVIRMTVAGQAVYWVEIEHQKMSDRYCSIALKVLTGADLDQATLSRVLYECVMRRGVWPKNVPRDLASTIKWSKGKHYSDDLVGLKASTILKKLQELGLIFDTKKPGRKIEDTGVGI